jgi:hypothetical protein
MERTIKHRADQWTADGLPPYYCYICGTMFYYFKDAFDCCAIVVGLWRGFDSEEHY